MSQSATGSTLDHLQDCVALASDMSHHADANQAFTRLQAQLSVENPQAAELLKVVWSEMIAARRSATFWEQICNVERDLSEKMAASHLQLQQNYLRLMQEQ